MTIQVPTLESQHTLNHDSHNSLPLYASRKGEYTYHYIISCSDRLSYPFSFDRTPGWQIPLQTGRRNPNYAQCVDSLCFYNDWGWEAVNIPSDFQAPQLLEPVIETQAWELRNCGIDRSSPVVTLVTISTDKKNFHYLIK